MEKKLTRQYRLAKELSELFDLESSIDNVLAVFMYKLNQLMETERSSVFLFDPLKQQLTSFSSQDLEKKEIRMPKSLGLSGWVLENLTPAVINNAYKDSRFYRGVDDMTGFRTRNLICAPLIDHKGKCLGTLQSLNKENGNFTTEDIKLLDTTANLVAVAITNSMRFNEIQTTNKARRKLINQIGSGVGNQPYW